MKRVIIVLCFIAILGCTEKDSSPAPAPAQEPEKPAAAPEKQAVNTPAAENTESSVSGKIALVYEKTSYKEKLINEMKSLLEQDGLQVTVALHSKKGVALENPADYSAIFITISGVNSKVRPWVADWLKANTAVKDRVVLHVTQTHDWKVGADVDTVTGASEDAPETKASEYVEKLKARLTSEK